MVLFHNLKFLYLHKSEITQTILKKNQHSSQIKQKEILNNFYNNTSISLYQSTQHVTTIHT